MVIKKDTEGMVINIDTARRVNGIDEQQLNLIRSFLQGAVYCLCITHRNQWFSARDFLGGENSNWQGTPLQALFDYYFGRRQDEDYAIHQAGKAVGWILLSVLIADHRVFETRKGYTREYLWTGR